VRLNRGNKGRYIGINRFRGCRGKSIGCGRSHLSFVRVVVAMVEIFRDFW
jgi:hypothetical protein